MSGSGFRPDSAAFTIVLGTMAALPPLSIDINAPTLPTVQAQFGAPSDIVGLSITLFMVGFAAGQFGGGPVSDWLGRRPVVLAALTTFIVSAAGCALAPSVAMLTMWRLLQGVAAGACAVLAFAMIRDLFDGDAARIKRSYVTVVFTLAPLLAPSIGAAVLEWSGWRPVYWLLCAAGIVLLAAVLVGVPETRRGGTEAPWSARHAYRRVFAERRFTGISVVNSFSYGAMFAYIAGGPQVIMGTMGLSPRQYGLLFACTAGALTLGAWTSGLCARRGIGPRPVLSAGLTVGAVTAVAFAALMWLGAPPVAWVLVLTAYVFCRGLVSPNAQHIALEPLPDQAGTAASVLGVTQILTGAASSTLVFGLLPWLRTSAMTTVIASFAVLALLAWWWITQPSRVDSFVAQDAD